MVLYGPTTGWITSGEERGGLARGAEGDVLRRKAGQHALDRGNRLLIGAAQIVFARLVENVTTRLPA